MRLSLSLRILIVNWEMTPEGDRSPISNFTGNGCFKSLAFTDQAASLWARVENSALPSRIRSVNWVR